SEEHTSELQSPCNLVCRLLLEKKKLLGFCENLRRPKGRLSVVPKNAAVADHLDLRRSFRARYRWSRACLIKVLITACLLQFSSSAAVSNSFSIGAAKSTLTR